MSCRDSFWPEAAECHQTAKNLMKSEMVAAAVALSWYAAEDTAEEQCEIFPPHLFFKVEQMAVDQKPIFWNWQMFSAKHPVISVVNKWKPAISNNYDDDSVDLDFSVRAVSLPLLLFVFACLHAHREPWAYTTPYARSIMESRICAGFCDV